MTPRPVKFEAKSREEIKTIFPLYQIKSGIQQKMLRKFFRADLLISLPHESLKVLEDRINKGYDTLKEAKEKARRKKN